MIWVHLILLIAVMSYREVQILIDRGSWKAIDHLNIFWYISWKSRWKNFDSFHVANGVATILILEMVVQYLPQPVSIEHWISSQMYVIVYWFGWMQIRNLFMKVL